jgi:hypothetical protein
MTKIAPTASPLPDRSPPMAAVTRYAPFRPPIGLQQPLIPLVALSDQTPQQSMRVTEPAKASPVIVPDQMVHKQPIDDTV